MVLDYRLHTDRDSGSVKLEKPKITKCILETFDLDKPGCLIFFFGGGVFLIVFQREIL